MLLCVDYKTLFSSVIMLFFVLLVHITGSRKKQLSASAVRLKGTNGMWICSRINYITRKGLCLYMCVVVMGC